MSSPSVAKEWEAKYPFDWEDKRQAYIDAAAALHNADMIAGGRYDSVVDESLDIRDRIGGSRENSSMGSQWQKNRAERLKAHAIQQSENGCPNVNVDLRICPSMTSEQGMPKDGTNYADW